MVKRLNDSSEQGSSVKRSRPDHQTAPSSPQKHFYLPPELQAEIVRNVAEFRDPVGSLRSLAALSRSSIFLKDEAERSLNQNYSIKQINDIMKVYNDVLEKIPYDTRASDRKSLGMKYLMSQADLMPMRTSEERTRIIKGLLKYKHNELPGASINNLIDNIEYAKVEERSRITTYALDYEEKGESVDFAESLVKRLISKSQYLTAKERSILIEKNSYFLSNEHAKRAATGWADKMDLLNENDQKRILAHFLDGNEKGNGYLRHFAKHLYKLTPTNRSALIKTSMETPHEQVGRWETFNELAKNLNYLNEQDRLLVSTVILKSSETPADEHLDRDGEHVFYDGAELYKLEAINSLSKHRKILSTDNIRKTNSFISQAIKIKNNVDISNICFIEHMTGQGERASVVKEALADGRDVIAYGLTMRIPELSPNEKAVYLEKIMGANDTVMDNCIRHNIRFNMKQFSETERSELVGHQLAFIRENPFSKRVGPALSEIAIVADQLHHEDVKRLIAATKHVITKRLDDDNLPDNARATVNSWASYAARGLAQWAGSNLIRDRASFMPLAKPENTEGKVGGSSTTFERSERTRESSIGR